MSPTTRSTALLLAVVLLAAADPGIGAPASADPAAARAMAIAQEVERLAREMDFWPGYAPLTIPLAIYTGEATYLFRHPAPPEGFDTVAEAPLPHARLAGRHPVMTANSSADLGGTPTATLLADGPRGELPPRAQAAVALHEAFHVFQRERHPHWIGNEGDLFLYPFEDADLLALRRAETEGFRRALAVSTRADSLCWTHRALEARGARFDRMEEAFRAYERGNEWNEGLAQYIQELAAGHTTVAIPPEGFGATRLRDRFYTTGPALAFLLDRFRPGWKKALEADDGRFLDALLREAVQTAADPSACAFSPAETAAFQATAQRDAAAILQTRAQHQTAFAALPGWRIIIEAAPGHPLWPQGFDPLNVERLDGGLLHTRFLRLGNDSGRFTMVDGEGADLEALTTQAGEHPLFQGIRRVEIAGLAKPTVDQKDGTVALQVPGLTAEFTGASVRQEGETIHLELPGDRQSSDPPR